MRTRHHRLEATLMKFVRLELSSVTVRRSLCSVMALSRHTMSSRSSTSPSLVNEPIPKLWLSRFRRSYRLCRALSFRMHGSLPSITIRNLASVRYIDVPVA